MSTICDPSYYTEGELSSVMEGTTQINVFKEQTVFAWSIFLARRKEL